MKLIGGKVKLTVYAKEHKKNRTTIAGWYSELEKRFRRPPTMEEMEDHRKSFLLNTCRGHMSVSEVVAEIKKEFGEKKIPSRNTIFNRRKIHGEDSRVIFYPLEGKKEFAARLVADGLVEGIAPAVPKPKKKPTTYLKKAIAKKSFFNKSTLAGRDAEYSRALKNSMTRSACY